MQRNLKKAPKFTYKALHSSNNKQNVNLAFAIFHETTIGACKSYLHDRQDMSSFLTLVNKWWTIADAKKLFVPNALGDTITAGNDKMDFFFRVLPDG